MHYKKVTFLSVSACFVLQNEYRTPKYVRLVCSVASMYGNQAIKVVCWCCGKVFRYDSKSPSRFFFFFNYVNKFLFPSWSIIPLLKVLAAVHFDICKKSKY